MSVRDRIDDSRLLFAAGRLEGAFLSVLTALAGTSRKRYPKHVTPDSREAFLQFLRDEEARFPNGTFNEINFEGRQWCIAEILWKFVRCDLSHEGQLYDKISVDYRDFLVDSRGTSDQLTFSSELIIRLSYVVETAQENVGTFPDGKYDRLPAPVELRQAAVIRFTWGEQRHECVSYACSIVSVEWESSRDVIEWLHLKANQLINGSIAGKPLTILVPTKYVTRIEPGPAFQLTKRRSAVDVGVFSPDKPAPPDAMQPGSIRDIVAALQIDQVSTLVQLRRPEYEVRGMDVVDHRASGAPSEDMYQT